MRELRSAKSSWMKTDMDTRDVFALRVNYTGRQARMQKERKINCGWTL